MATLKSTGQVTITKILNAVSAVLTNNPVSVYAQSDGTVTDYTKTSTGIYVYEGPNQLTYDATGITKGTWRINSISATGITPGSVSDGGGYALTANHSAMTADNAQIVYTLVGLNSAGEAFSLNITQNLSKTKTGANGQTTYTWIVYADTAAGDGISRTSTNKRYIGIAVNKTTAAPSDNDLLNPGQFSWSPLYENVEVGGKNLIYYSDTLINSTTQKVAQYDLVEEWIPGREYTISLYSSTKNLSIGIMRDESNSYTATIPPLIYDTVKDRYSLTFTAPGPIPGDVTRRILSIFNLSFATNPNVNISRIQLEKGNVVTDWTPAVEDLQSKIINPNILKGSGDYSAFKTDLWIYNTSKAEKTLAQGFISFKALNTTTSTYIELPIEGPTVSNEAYTLSGKIEASTIRTITIVGRDDSNNVVTLLSLPIQVANQKQLFSISFKTPYNLTKIGFTAGSIPVVGDTLTIEWLKLEKGVFATPWVAHVNDGALWQNYTAIALNGKNHIFWQTTQPTYGMIEGDIWYNTATLNNGVGGGIYRYTSGTWQEYELGSNAIAELAIQNAHIAELDAAKIIAHTITADKIQAGTITSTEIKAGSLTANDIKAGTLADVAGKNSLNLNSGDFSLGNSAVTYNAGTGALNIVANSVKIGATSVATTTYADGKASTAENNAKTYADTKATAAQNEAKTYTDTEISIVNGVIANKVSTTTYNAGIGSKEDTIYKQSTAPAHAAGRLWLDTTTTPNVLKRSTGSAWVKVTPTTAAEVGAYSSSDGNTLAGRITTAESNITQQAGQIASKVEQSTYNTKIGLLESSISTVTQTANSVRLDFDNQVVGGRNFLLASGVPITTADYLMNSYDLTEAIAAGTKVTLTLKGSLAATKTTFTAYNSGGSVALSDLNSLGNGIYRKTFNWTVGTASNTFVSIYQKAIGQTGTSTIEWIKLEKGNTPTDWSQAPEELFTGTTRIDKDGVTVGVSNDTIESNLSNEGVRIYDNTNPDEPIAIFGSSGSLIPALETYSITGDVINTLPGSLTFNIGSGKDYASVSAALATLNVNKKLTKFLSNHTIDFNIYGTISDNIIVNNFIGGTMNFNFQSGSKLVGSFYFAYNTTRITISGPSTTNYATIQRSSGDYLIDSFTNSYIEVRFMNLDGKNYATARGMRFYNGSTAYVINCDFSRMEHGIMSYYGSQLFAVGNRGNVTGYGYNITSAAFYARSSCPTGATGNVSSGSGHYFTTGTITAAPTQYMQSAPVAQTYTETFYPSSMLTYKHGTTTRSTYYGNTAAQGKYSGMPSAVDGVIKFGTDAYDFTVGATITKIELSVYRTNTSHGPIAGVQPLPDDFTSTPAFNAIGRGVWSNWVVVPNAELTSTGASFKFYHPTLNSGYAIFSNAKLRITVSKTV